MRVCVCIIYIYIYASSYWLKVDVGLFACSQAFKNGPDGPRLSNNNIYNTNLNRNNNNNDNDNNYYYYDNDDDDDDYADNKHNNDNNNIEQSFIYTNHNTNHINNTNNHNTDNMNHTRSYVDQTNGPDGPRLGVALDTESLCLGPQPAVVCICKEIGGVQYLKIPLLLRI